MIRAFLLCRIEARPTLLYTQVNEQDTTGLHRMIYDSNNTQNGYSQEQNNTSIHQLIEDVYNIFLYIRTIK